MKGTEQFIQTITEYPNGHAMANPLFTPNLQKPHKNIEECILYILSEVQRSGCNGFADGGIYSMAVHCYDEDDIAVNKVADCDVVVNHVVELSEEKKRQYQREKLVKLQERDERPKETGRTEATSATQPQPTLFDTLAL